MTLIGMILLVSFNTLISEEYSQYLSVPYETWPGCGSDPINFDLNAHEKAQTPPRDLEVPEDWLYLDNPSRAFAPMPFVKTSRPGSSDSRAFTDIDWDDRQQTQIHKLDARQPGESPTNVLALSHLGNSLSHTAEPFTSTHTFLQYPASHLFYLAPWNGPNLFSPSTIKSQVFLSVRELFGMQWDGWLELHVIVYSSGMRNPMWERVFFLLENESPLGDLQVLRNHLGGMVSLIRSAEDLRILRCQLTIRPQSNLAPYLLKADTKTA